jgi:hypothetical protein
LISSVIDQGLYDMALQLFAFPGFPHDIAVTKNDDVSAQVCPFFLDFNRPLRKVRKFGVVNDWIGRTVLLGVPVVHQGERAGGFVISVPRGDPYFDALQTLWKQHAGTTRGMMTSPAGGLDIIADFARNFEEDSRVPR